MNVKRLTSVLRWVAVVLILRVLAATLANYPDYFPPNFNSLFLEGREATFTGWYPTAFYVHIFSGPFVLVNGLILLSDSFRRRHSAWHRRLGRIQVAVLLLLLLPSSVIMARQAFGGWLAGLSFELLSLVTAGCAIAGVATAIQRRFDRHRRWMSRTYLLICSTVVLRLTLGAAGVFGVTNVEAASIIGAWTSWVIPLAVYETVRRWPSIAVSRQAPTRFELKIQAPPANYYTIAGFVPGVPGPER